MGRQAGTLYITGLLLYRCYLAIINSTLLNIHTAATLSYILPPGHIPIKWRVDLPAANSRNLGFAGIWGGQGGGVGPAGAPGPEMRVALGRSPCSDAGTAGAYRQRDPFFGTPHRDRFADSHALVFFS